MRASRKKKVAVPVLMLCTSASRKPLYEALGLPESATRDEVHASYLGIARAHHPDLNDGEPSELFARAKHAHDVLFDPAKRRMYGPSYRHDFGATCRG